jgi:lambda family phage minor tail protein L
MSDLDNLVRDPNLPPYIQLFELDLTTIGRPEIFYYTPMTDRNGQVVVRNGQPYQPFPISISGLEKTTTGAPPRAELHIANVLEPRLFGTLAALYGDLIGVKVTYIRTFEVYLNSSMSAPPWRFEIRKLKSKNKNGLVFEMRSPLDRDRKWLPARQMLKKDFPGIGINKGAA